MGIEKCLLVEFFVNRELTVESDLTKLILTSCWPTVNGESCCSVFQKSFLSSTDFQQAIANLLARLFEVFFSCAHSCFI